MPVLLSRSSDLPGPSAFATWFAVTGARGRGPEERKLPELPRRLDAAFGAIREEWWKVARGLAGGPGAELAYATTAAGYGSDFGLMMAWGHLTGQVAREPGTHLVVCDDPWLFRHLASLPGVEAGSPPPLWPRAIRLRLRGFLARMKLMVKLSSAALATRRQRRAHGPGDTVILVYGHPTSTAGGFDAYFGPMMTEIPGLKRALHTDCGKTRAAELAADDRTASLHAWGSPWWTPGLLFQRWRPRPEDLSGRYGWLVRRAAETEAGGGAHAMNAWQRMCQEAWLADVRPSVVAWPWENHGWERAFSRTARRSGVATVGYQHTVIGPHQLNFSPATNVDGEASLPEVVVCNGPAYRNQLADWGVPADRLVIGGSFRIQRFENDCHDPAAPVFVALSASRSIARQQMRAVEAAAGDGHRFLVKEHPMYPLAFEETDHIRRTQGTIPEQAALSAVFYATGTSGLEALLAGLPTFRLLPENEIAIDVLPDFVTDVPVAADGLAGALAEARKPPPLNWEDVLAPVDWNLWRRLLAAGGAEARAPDPDPTPKKEERIA